MRRACHEVRRDVEAQIVGFVELEAGSQPSQLSEGIPQGFMVCGACAREAGTCRLKDVGFKRHASRDKLSRWNQNFASSGGPLPQVVRFRLEFSPRVFILAPSSHPPRVLQARGAASFTACQPSSSRGCNVSVSRQPGQPCRSHRFSNTGGLCSTRVVISLALNSSSL